MQRRRSIPHTFEDRIAAEKARLEAQVAKLPHGPQKDGLLKKISQLDTASHINEWLTSPGFSRRQSPSSKAALVGGLYSRRSFFLDPFGPASIGPYPARSPSIPGAPRPLLFPRPDPYNYATIRR